MKTFIALILKRRGHASKSAIQNGYIWLFCARLRLGVNAKRKPKMFRVAGYCAMMPFMIWRRKKPKSLQAMGKLRGIPNGFERSSAAKSLLEAILAAIDNAADYAPTVPKPIHMPPNLGPRIEMLKTLLRLRTEAKGIAPRLVANARDIDQLAAFGEGAKIDALSGWRRDIFGDDALDLLRGKISLRLQGDDVIAERTL